MVEGLEKKELEAKKTALVKEIAELEIEEKKQSGIVHTSTAEKARLKAKIIYAKNKLGEYNKLIDESHEIKTGSVIPR